MLNVALEYYVITLPCLPIANMESDFHRLSTLSCLGHVSIWVRHWMFAASWHQTLEMRQLPPYNRLLSYYQNVLDRQYPIIELVSTCSHPNWVLLVQSRHQSMFELGINDTIIIRYMHVIHYIPLLYSVGKNIDEHNVWRMTSFLFQVRRLPTI